MLATVLLVFAFVLCVVAAWFTRTAPGYGLGWAGMACYFAAILFGGTPLTIH